MEDMKITSGKYAGRFISDLCKDRRYMNWIMTTWDHSSTIPKDIKKYIDAQKNIIKHKYTSTNDLNFVKEWLATSYEGYKITHEDIEWVQNILDTTSDNITIEFLRSEYVFTVGTEQFSLKHMIVNERKDVFAAFRNDIQDQIKNFKDNSFRRNDTIKCSETGILMKQNADAHVDHHFRKKIFNQLVEDFLDNEHINFIDIIIENCGMFYRLKDRTFAERWNEYHKEHAILRLIHVSANTNAGFYLSKYKEPPFEQKENKNIIKKIPDPICMTFDMLKK